MWLKSVERDRRSGPQSDVRAWTDLEGSMTGNIAGMIDHTLLRPDANSSDIRRLCGEAMEYSFHSVCVNPFYISLAADLLAGSGVRVTTVIGFPLGMPLTQVKAFEAIEARLSGADELDIVMNIGAAKSGDWDTVRKDISAVLAASAGAVRKVIIETGVLTADEMRTAAGIVSGLGAEFVKTSTGFMPAGARADDIRLIRAVVGDRCGIKASGGIKTLGQVREFIAAGAARIGTSAGVQILKELHQRD